MTHDTNIKRLNQSAEMDRRTADDLNAEVLDGRATEYEVREGFQPGYIANLAMYFDGNAERLEKKAKELESKYTK